MSKHRTDPDRRDGCLVLIILLLAGAALAVYLLAVHAI